jgi:hypothetical protein
VRIGDTSMTVISVDWSLGQINPAHASINLTQCRYKRCKNWGTGKSIQYELFVHKLPKKR